MDFVDKKFVDDLRNGLRNGMTEALRHYKSLSSVDVSGVERTLYPIIREYCIKYLESLGYNYLTNNPNFFVIGETSITGTNKRSDGFICDPYLGKPIYAIEIGISNSEKFWSDYKKCVDEWSRTDIEGAFILLFDTSGKDKNINYLDGSELKTAKNSNFSIYPLILPISPNYENALSSITCSKYFERHNQQLFFKTFTLSDRNKSNIVGPCKRWTDDVIAPVVEKQNKFFINKIINSESISEQQLKETLDLKPNLIVLQGGICPFKSFNDNMRILFKHYIAEKKPIITIFADHLQTNEWENDSILKDLLPVKFIGENNKDGKWDYFSNYLYFGKDIKAVPGSFLDLSAICDNKHYVSGFAKTEVIKNKDVDINMTIEADGIKYPFIVTVKSQKIVFIASGTGGWGLDWYKYDNGFRILWSEIIKKLI